MSKQIELGQAVVDLVNKAMRMAENPAEWLNCTSGEKQLAQALELYEDRGEYDGTFRSAVDCLELAGYIDTKETENE